MINKQWILKNFPVGDIKEGDLVMEDTSVPELNENELLI